MYFVSAFPLAATVNVAFCPAVTFWPAGCVVIAGPALTVSAAAFDVAVPALLAATTRYWAPVNPVETLVSVSVAVVTPL